MELGAKEHEKGENDAGNKDRKGANYPGAGRRLRQWAIRGGPFVVFWLSNRWETGDMPRYSHEQWQRPRRGTGMSQNARQQDKEAKQKKKDE